MCVAISQFWPNWTPIVVVGGTFFVGEMLADYVLAPRIIGRRVKLNPVWLMFALFAFGAVFGFIGLLLASRSRPRSGCFCALRSENPKVALADAVRRNELRVGIDRDEGPEVANARPVILCRG